MLVPFSERPERSVFALEHFERIARGKYKSVFEGVPMQKDPMSLEIYRSMLEDQRFGAIIEFGTLFGSSAAWFARMAPGTPVFSFDIDPSRVSPKFRGRADLEFMHLDANAPQCAGELDRVLASAPHPWLVVEVHAPRHVPRYAARTPHATRPSHALSLSLSLSRCLTLRVGARARARARVAGLPRQRCGPTQPRNGARVCGRLLRH